jgi:hypothetical protein
MRPDMKSRADVAPHVSISGTVGWARAIGPRVDRPVGTGLHHHGLRRGLCRRLLLRLLLGAQLCAMQFALAAVLRHALGGFAHRRQALVEQFVARRRRHLDGDGLHAATVRRRRIAEARHPLLDRTIDRLGSARSRREQRQQQHW